MLLSKDTINILKNFSQINTNLVIKKGSKIETVSPTKDIIASYDCDEVFEDVVSIFNLNEFLAVIDAFEKPELNINEKSMIIKQGKQKVNYIFAEESLLITPPNNKDKIISALENPAVSFTLTDSVLSKLQKMSAILAAPDLSVIGDGSKIVLKVFDKKNPSCNEFEIDTEVSTNDIFQINFKIEKLKLYPGTYNVDISSKKISKFTNTGINLVYYVAVESDSEFAD